MNLTPIEQTTIAYLHTLGHKDGVTEFRILDAGQAYGGKIVRRNRATVSGYYDTAHYEKGVIDIRPYIGVGNVYATLNPAHPDLRARSCNRLTHFPKATTGDDEVIRLCWLPIDVDPYRPAEIPSTDAELAAALKRRDRAVAYLVSILGDGHHITGMSGNGGHALFRVDLTNNAESRALLKEIGDGMARMFSDPREEGVQVYDPPRVGLDATVYNPARIWKLPGTIAIKGDSVPHLNRIHRRATVELRDVTPADLGGLK